MFLQYISIFKLWDLKTSNHYWTGIISSWKMWMSSHSPTRGFHMYVSALFVFCGPMWYISLRWRRNKKVNDKWIHYRCCNGRCLSTGGLSGTSAWGHHRRHGIVVVRLGLNSLWFVTFSWRSAPGGPWGHWTFPHFFPWHDFPHGVSGCAFSTHCRNTFLIVFGGKKFPSCLLSWFLVTRCTTANPGYATPWTRKPEHVYGTELPSVISIANFWTISIHPLPDKRHDACIILELK